MGFDTIKINSVIEKGLQSFIPLLFLDVFEMPLNVRVLKTFVEQKKPDCSGP